MTREIVSGKRGYRMTCQWSGRRIHAVSRNPYFCRRERITFPKQASSASRRICRLGKSRQVMKKKRSDSTRRRKRDTSGIIRPITWPRAAESLGSETLRYLGSPALGRDFRLEIQDFRNEVPQSLPPLRARLCATSAPPAL